MQQLASSRYNRKIVSYPNTTNFEQEELTRKSSADQQHASFKLGRLLPKLQTTSNRVEIPSEIQNQKYYTKNLHLYRSQPRDKLSFTKINFHKGNNDKEMQNSRYQALSKQGKRSYNQDRYLCVQKMQSLFPQPYSKAQQYELYAVFDGHGGAQCSQFLKQNFSLLLSRSRLLDSDPEQALKQTFFKIQQKFLTICQSKEPLETSGSCAVICLLSLQNIYVANLGDSRAILLSDEGYLQLTHDHKPHEQGQRMRILKHGGKIYRDHQDKHKHMKIFRQMRIFPGNLNVSRTIGDAEVKLKKYGGLPGMISSVPDVATFSTRSFNTLMLATDGLFQAFNTEEIHKMFVNRYQERKENTFIKTLCEQAETKSSDNITIVMVNLI